jgi:hypothetical protein
MLEPLYSKERDTITDRVGGRVHCRVDPNVVAKKIISTPTGKYTTHISYLTFKCEYLQTHPNT